LVFADEPIASLDTQGGREVLDLLLDIARGVGGAVVLVTHDNTVAALADREVRLHEGVISSDAVLR
jgi:putative ABC transport system ATP-binding protein